TGFTATGDQVGTTASKIDPLLGPLQDNGGPTDTVALLDGSPALDQGMSFGLAVDQRGLTRSIDAAAFTNPTGGDGTDVGAFERIDVGPLATPTPTPTPEPTPTPTPTPTPVPTPTPTPTPIPPRAVLANISTRLRVE